MPHSNRSPGRYTLPGYIPRLDTREWVVNLPFFLGSAIKYVWRGWDYPADLTKAADSLRIHMELARKGTEETKAIQENCRTLISDLSAMVERKDVPPAKAAVLSRLTLVATQPLALSNILDRIGHLNTESADETISDS